METHRWSAALILTATLLTGVIRSDIGPNAAVAESGVAPDASMVEYGVHPDVTAIEYGSVPVAAPGDSRPESM
jgi:hypothetical protein